MGSSTLPLGPPGSQNRRPGSRGAGWQKRCRALARMKKKLHR